MATVEASLEAISITDNNILEDDQKINDCVLSESATEPAKVSKDDTNQKDSDCEEEKSCTSRPNEKLSSSKGEAVTVDSKMKAAASSITVDGGSKKLRYYGSGVGTFLT